MNRKETKSPEVKLNLSKSNGKIYTTNKMMTRTWRHKLNTLQKQR